MRLYHNPLSSNARRAVMAAMYLGVPVDLQFVDLAKGANRTPAYLALNPNHKVPVLDDNGFVLWESYAIMQYLAEKTPGQSIYPTDGEARADVNRWLFWCAQHFSPAIGILNWEHHIKPLAGLGKVDAQEAARGEQLVREFGAILDGHLADREWICGATITLADIAIAAPLADIESARLPVGDFRNVQRWFAQIRALDVWRRTEPQLSLNG
jgi:glutathione S-transferase